MLESIALKLLLLAAGEERLVTSTSALAESCDESEQAVARVLTDLAARGCVTHLALAGGIEIILTEKGRMALQSLKQRLADALGDTDLLAGSVVAGKGEGRYYISLGPYRDALAQLLGGEPYPGTLNLRVDPARRIAFLSGRRPHVVDGFTEGDRTYGQIHYYPVRVAGIHCGLIVPLRTQHGPDTVELVSTVPLRSQLNLADDEQVVIDG